MYLRKSLSIRVAVLAFSAAAVTQMFGATGAKAASLLPGLPALPLISLPTLPGLTPIPPTIPAGTVDHVCRAVGVAVLGQGVVANPNGRPCKTASTALVPAIPPGLIPPVSVTLGVVTADTVNKADQAIAQGGAANVVITLPGVIIQANAVSSQVQSHLAACGTKTNDGTSTVLNLSINGTIYNGSDHLSIPLPGLGSVELNQRLVVGNTLQLTALQVNLGSLGTVIVGQTLAGLNCIT